LGWQLRRGVKRTGLALREIGRLRPEIESVAYTACASPRKREHAVSVHRVIVRSRGRVPERFSKRDAADCSPTEWNIVTRRSRIHLRHVRFRVERKSYFFFYAAPGVRAILSGFFFLRADTICRVISAARALKNKIKVITIK